VVTDLAALSLPIVVVPIGVSESKNCTCVAADCPGPALLMVAVMVTGVELVGLAGENTMLVTDRSGSPIDGAGRALISSATIRGICVCTANVVGTIESIKAKIIIRHDIFCFVEISPFGNAFVLFAYKSLCRNG